MSDNTLVTCHFTAAELRHINLIMVRERYLCGHVIKSIEDLRVLGVGLEYAEAPANLVGKILSYIKKAELGSTMSRAKEVP